MEQTPAPPILMGVYRYPRMMTSKSEPTILGVLPGRVWLVGQGGVLFELGSHIDCFDLHLNAARPWRIDGHIDLAELSKVCSTLDNVLSIHFLNIIIVVMST